jgi:hypothetical protein
MTAINSPKTKTERIAFLPSKRANGPSLGELGAVGIRAGTVQFRRAGQEDVKLLAVHFITLSAAT